MSDKITPTKYPFRFPVLDVTIWAETEEEAKKLASQNVKEITKKDLEIDLNQDGKFDKEDATIAGKTLNEAKNIKQ